MPYNFYTPEREVIKGGTHDMENVVNEIKNLFSAYGFKAVLIVVLTVILVNVIKKPVMKKFVSVAEKNGYDKSLVTKNFNYAAFVVAIFLEFLSQVILNSFNFCLIDFTEIFSVGTLYGGMAIALYETVKLELKAYSSKSNKTENETQSLD